LLMSEGRKTSQSKEALFRLVFLLIIGIGTSLFSLMCSKEVKSIPEEFRVLSLNDLYPRALEEAKRWKEDTYLNGAGFWVAPLEDEHKLRASFGFESEKDPEWLIVVFRETDSGIEITSTKKGEYPFSDGKPRLDLDDVEYDSLEAFQKMHEEEGRRLFQKYPDMIYPIVLDISCYSKQDMKWIAIYEPVGLVSWTITMDAKTNEITEVKVIDE